VIAARGVRVVLDGSEILAGIDLSVGPGEFVGLIGANGAGKTTLLRVLLGALRPSGGTVRFTSGRRVGYVPQKVSLAPDTPMRARDVVALGLDGGRLGLPWRSRADRAKVDETLDAVGAREFAEQRIGELSGGQQQRVLIAHSIIAEPALLLLDEPLANLDPASASDVVRLLDRLRSARDVAVVMTAHDLSLILPVVDRIAYLAGGHLVSGTPDAVVRDDVLTRLYGRPIRVVRAEGRILVLSDEPAPRERAS
jgi:zinc/manganese transport system ATP-binding protein